MFILLSKVLSLSYDQFCNQILSLKEILEVSQNHLCKGNFTIPPFFGGYGTTSKQPAILSYQNIIFDGFIFILCSSNIVCDNSFVTFGGSLNFSHI